MKKRRLNILSAVLAAAVLMGGCGAADHTRQDNRSVEGSTVSEASGQTDEGSALSEAGESEARQNEGLSSEEETISGEGESSEEGSGKEQESPEEALAEEESSPEGEGTTEEEPETSRPEEKAPEVVDSPPVIKSVSWDDSLKYAEYSKIHSDSPKLYEASGNRRGIVVAVNAGHGTSGGGSVKTKCHPDGTGKVTGGSTAKGSVTAVSVSGGTTLLDGSTEAEVVLDLAKRVKEKLLKDGFDVLMIREDSDVQLDNIARTVLANHYADCHISLHYDSTSSNKGFFYISVPEVSSYRKMEPVASHWKEHHRLGEAILSGVKNQGVKIYSSGHMAIDLTQTSYSTIPSVDLEVGDRASSHSKSDHKKLAAGIVEGLEEFFA